MEQVSLLRGLGVGALAHWCQGYANRDRHTHKTVGGWVQSPLVRQTEMTGGRWVQSPFTVLAVPLGANVNGLFCK